MEKTKILFVDDEKLNLMLFQISFKKKYKVFTADSGVEAIKILDENKDIRVVVSDMKMPDMNGIEFIKIAHQKFPQASYYVLTGYSTTDEIQHAINIGLIQKHFIKPFNRDDIVIEINKTISS